MVGAVLLLAGAAFVGGQPGPLRTWFSDGQTGVLLSWIPRWGVVLAIDFLWSFSYTFWPRRPGTSWNVRPTLSSPWLVPSYLARSSPVPTSRNT